MGSGGHCGDQLHSKQLGKEGSMGTPPEDCLGPHPWVRSPQGWAVAQSCSPHPRQATGGVGRS